MITQMVFSHGKKGRVLEPISEDGKEAILNHLKKTKNWQAVFFSKIYERWWDEKAFHKYIPELLMQGYVIESASIVYNYESYRLINDYFNIARALMLTYKKVTLLYAFRFAIYFYSEYHKRLLAYIEKRETWGLDKRMVQGTKAFHRKFTSEQYVKLEAQCFQEQIARGLIYRQQCEMQKGLWYIHGFHILIYPQGFESMEEAQEKADLILTRGYYATFKHQ